jgi:hypothetical protein
MIERAEELLERYISDHQVDGVPYTRHSHGLYWTDDDNALYTGLMLGAMAYRWAADPSDDKLDAIRMCLRGTDLLLRATGDPGVLVRRAMHRDQIKEFGGAAYLDQKPCELIGDYWVQLKTTRDQVTGVMFGLTCCIALVRGADPMIDEAVDRQVKALYTALKRRQWSLRDHNYETHGTSAHKLDAGLRLLIRVMAKAIGAEGEVETESWFDWQWITTAHYNVSFQAAYSHGLNAINAHALWLLRPWNPQYRQTKRWMSRIESVVRDEFNPFWQMLLDFRLSPEGDIRLMEAGEEIYSRFFRWNRYKKELTMRQDTEGPGIDYMIVAYMAAYWDGRN